jgi:hypothetical protein
VGVDQVNAQIPPDEPEGCRVPLTLIGDTILSEPVTISIRKGGGPCQDAPVARIGSLHWAKTVTTGPDSALSTSLETIQATLVEAPSNQVDSALSGAIYPRFPADTSHVAPNCPGSAGHRLDAGKMTVTSGIGNAFTFSPAVVSGELIYQATLPNGTIQPGTVHLNAAGGPDIGPFQADISFPPPIQITTSLPPGTPIASNKAFRLDWSSGTPDVNVEVLLGSPVLGVYDYYGLSVPGDRGTITLDLVGPQDMRYFPIPPNNPAVVDVRVTPVQQPQGFTAPTLARPGTQSWMYEYRFTGLQWK